MGSVAVPFGGSLIDRLNDQIQMTPQLTKKRHLSDDLDAVENRCSAVCVTVCGRNAGSRMTSTHCIFPGSATYRLGCNMDRNKECWALKRTVATSYLESSHARFRWRCQSSLTIASKAEELVVHLDRRYTDGNTLNLWKTKNPRTWQCHRRPWTVTKYSKFKRPL